MNGFFIAHLDETTTPMEFRHATEDMADVKKTLLHTTILAIKADTEDPNKDATLTPEGCNLRLAEMDPVCARVTCLKLLTRRDGTVITVLELHPLGLQQAKQKICEWPEISERVSNGGDVWGDKQDFHVTIAEGDLRENPIYVSFIETELVFIKFEFSWRQVPCVVKPAESVQPALLCSVPN